MINVTLPDNWQPYITALIADIDGVETTNDLVRLACRKFYNEWKTKQLNEAMLEARDTDEYNRQQQLQQDLQNNLI